jgi:uncharacterized protein YerC
MALALSAFASAIASLYKLSICYKIMSVLIAYCNVKQYIDIIRVATALEIGACTNKYGDFH